MVSISRKEIEELKDVHIVKTSKKSADLVGYFLHLFEEGKPLQREAVEDWRDNITAVPAAHIKQCLKEALDEGYVEEMGGEIFITELGKKKAEDVLPIGPDLACCPAELCDFIQPCQNLTEAIQSRFQVFDDLLGKIVRLWQVIEVREALVLKPEDIEACLVARGQLLVGELAPVDPALQLERRRGGPFQEALGVGEAVVHGLRTDAHLGHRRRV